MFAFYPAPLRSLPTNFQHPLTRLPALSLLPSVAVNFGMRERGSKYPSSIYDELACLALLFVFRTTRVPSPSNKIFHFHPASPPGVMGCGVVEAIGLCFVC